MTMKKSKTLQHIAAVAAVLLTLCLVFMMPGAAEPVISGTVIEVNPSNVQDYLDGKSGDITGKTLLLEAGDYGTLYLARATNYTGSNTEYKCENGNSHSSSELIFSDANDFSVHRADGKWHASPKYNTTFKDVTIKAADGATVTVAGVMATSGHIYQNAHDYVLDTEVTSTNNGYYTTIHMSNIVFEGITFDGKIDINTSDADTVYDGVTFRDCSFTTGGTDSSNGAAIRYYNEANNGQVKNIIVDGCSFENCYQGVYVHHVNGVTVTGSTFDTTGHNAIGMQGHAGAVNLEIVNIKDNFFKNINNRAIRFGNVGTGTTITINNNIMVNSGDSDEQLIAAVSVASSGVTVNLENNYWDSKGLSKAIGDGFTAPTAVGIISGTWSSDVTPYVAEGYASVLTDGKYVVEAIAPEISKDVEKFGFDSVKVGYTQPEAQEVTITNMGNVPVTLTASTVSGNYEITVTPATEIALEGTAKVAIKPKAGLAVGNYADTLTIQVAGTDEVLTIPVSFLVYQPSSGGSSTTKPEEPVEPEIPVEPENPTEEPEAGEPTVETEVTDGGEVLFEAPVEPETPGADTPSDEPAEPTVTGVELPAGTDSEVAFIPVSEKPAPAGKEENTKKVFEINVPKYEKGKPATVKFTMTVAELAADGKTAADVALWHQDEETGEWTKLVTTFVIIDGVVYFEAITFDFSPFAIVYEDVSAPTEPETPEQPTESPAPILAVLAGLGAAVVLRRK